MAALSWQVKSKTVAQCVEYYYTWKKIMRLGRKHRTRLAEIIDDCMVRVLLSRSSVPSDPSDPSALSVLYSRASKWLVCFGFTR